MTKLVLDSKILLEGVQDIPQQSVEELKKRSSLPNPLYLRKLALRMPIWNTPKNVQLWESINHNGVKSVVLHRGALRMVLSVIRKHGGKINITDNRCLKSTVSFATRPLLRDYQQSALPPSIAEEQGMLIAPAGSGKTEIGMALIAEIQQPTLWLTHTTDLLEQATRRAKAALGISGKQLGAYGSGKRQLGTHLTVATVQTLAKMTEAQLTEFGKNFGMVIVDEAHRAAAGIETMKSFERVLSYMPAYYRFGLTASEHRSDGLMETVYHIIGPKFHEIFREAIPEYLIVPSVQFIYTGWTWSYDQSKYDRLPFSLMLSEMSEDARRNELLVRNILQYGVGHMNLILGDTLAGLQLLRNEVAEIAGDHRCVFIHGGTPKKERTKAVADMRHGKKQFMFATYALAKEGLDIPCLDRLFLTTPKKDRTVVEQSIGRISRPFEGKADAIVYDYVDSHPLCLRHARERIKTVYTPQACPLSGWQNSRKNTLETLKTAFN
jgi:superfamily II DNA or RNA helicase